MLDYGLMDKWMAVNYPTSPRCLASIKQAREQQQKTSKSGQPPSITLNNFAGIFVALLIGYALSILTFITELTVSRCSCSKLYTFFTYSFKNYI